VPTQPITRATRALLPLAAAILLAPAGWAQTTEAPASTKPFPAIEAGMHTAAIRRIAVDRAGRWAVTASHDKTARVWDLRTGALLQVLRVPVGEGPEGKLYAVALSPDGELVALGGFTSPDGLNTSIYLFDRASGRLRQRLAGLPNVVLHLAFSADGRRLAAALGGANGIRVYGATGQSTWAQVAADGDYGADSYSVEFDAAGRLLATSYDGELRLYGAGASGRLQPLVRRSAPGGKQPFFARFSPDGRRIAVGFVDSTAVALLDGTSLEPLAPADTSAFTIGTLNTVAWSADGRRLLAAGRYQQGDGSRPLVVWPAGGGPAQQLPLGMTNTVMDLRPLADGRLVYAGSDPAWGVLDPQLRRIKVFAGPPVLDHRSDAMTDRARTDGFQSFRLAPDGRWLEFRAVSRSAQGPTARLVRFDLAQRRLLLPGAAAPGGLAPRSIGLPIEGWYDTTSPTLAGKPLPLEKEDNDESRSLAISANGSSFALGTERAVRFFEADGTKRWRTYTPGQAWLVNLSPDGRFVVAALGDGTIRWYRTRAEGSAPAGSEALSLFVHPDLKRWILWTPEGFYDASPGGAELFGYHLNNGREQPGSFISSAQLQQKFFRPDLIARRLDGTPDDEAAIAAAVAEVGDVRTSLSTASLPPTIRLIGSPRRLDSGEIEVTYELIDQGGGIGGVDLLIDGQVLSSRSGFTPPIQGLSRAIYPRISRRRDGTSPRVEAVARAPGRRGASSQPIPIPIPPSLLEARRPGRLHLLAVGISTYNDSRLREGVTYAADDARTFYTAFSGGRAAVPVASSQLLIDPQATAERIRRELERYGSQARGQKDAVAVDPNDVFVLYLAGHGETDAAGDYVFRPVDQPAGGPGLGGPELLRLLSDIPSINLVVVLDTCSAGSFRDAFQLSPTMRRLNLLSGRAVLAGSTSRGTALEHPDLGGGLFTGVLLSGLRGNADMDNSNDVSVHEIVTFTRRELKRISEERFGGEQKAVYFQPDDDFALTRSGRRP